ncbi:UNVERIFIED_CONTAM: hypothetical protein RMT77_011861 [Armadillidium vulgare]
MAVLSLMDGYFKSSISLKKLQILRRFTCSIQEDGIWGNFENGEWLGMIGEVYRNKTDIVIGSLDHTYERSLAADFALAVVDTRYKMALHLPRRRDEMWSSYVMEMTQITWLVFVMFSLLFCVTISFLSRYSPQETIKISITDAMLVVVGSFSSNANQWKISSISTRITMIIIFFSSYLIYSHYVAFLISSLTFSRTKLPFTTLEGLLGNKKFGFGFEKGTSLEEQFKRAKNPTFQRVWQTFVRDKDQNLPENDDEGIARVKSGHYVYVLEELSFQYNYAKDCSLKMVNPPIIRIPSSFAFRKNSYLKNAVNYHLQIMKEYGILDKLWQKWNPRLKGCQKERNGNRFYPLDIWNVFSAFFLLFSFLILSVLILIVEKRKKLKKRKKKRSLPATNQLANYYKQVALKNK